MAVLVEVAVSAILFAAIAQAGDFREFRLIRFEILVSVIGFLGGCRWLDRVGLIDTPRIAPSRATAAAALRTTFADGFLFGRNGSVFRMLAARIGGAFCVGGRRVNATLHRFPFFRFGAALRSSSTPATTAATAHRTLLVSCRSVNGIVRAFFFVHKLRFDDPVIVVGRGAAGLGGWFFRGRFIDPLWTRSGGRGRPCGARRGGGFRSRRNGRGAVGFGG
ncbi:MAG TPA: hypothetical protein VHV08_11880 [Pirellulales bacterium]|jgi:hypothetical protein|nr:hypothetical protein [Pirellulales bacterium]